MYYDLHLRFDNEAEADAVLYDTRTYTENGETKSQKVPKYAAIDVIGVIYAPTGKTLNTEEGPTPEMAPISGWHVNVRHTAEMPELAAFAVVVKTPVRMWA